jgi:hypothetical protein
MFEINCIGKPLLETFVLFSGKRENSGFGPGSCQCGAKLDTDIRCEFPHFAVLFGKIATGISIVEFGGAPARTLARVLPFSEHLSAN